MSNKTVNCWDLNMSNKTVNCWDLSMSNKTVGRKTKQIYANPVILGGLFANGKYMGRCLPMLNR